MADRPVRSCDACGLEDDHPRHVWNTDDGRLLVRHIDCCAAAGCETCEATEVEVEGRRGQELIDYLEATRG